MRGRAGGAPEWDRIRLEIKRGKNKYPQLGELQSCGGEAAPPGPVKCQRGEENPGFSPKNGREREGRSRRTAGEEQEHWGWQGSGESQKIQALRNADFGKGGSLKSQRIWPQIQKNSRGSGKGPKFNWNMAGRGRKQLPAPGTELGTRSKGNPPQFQTKITSKGAGSAPFNPKLAPKGQILPYSTQNWLQRGQSCPIQLKTGPKEADPAPSQPNLSSKVDPAPSQPQTHSQGASPSRADPAPLVAAPDPGAGGAAAAGGGGGGRGGTS